jgi:type IV pilus assembly protein PilA
MRRSGKPQSRTTTVSIRVSALFVCLLLTIASMTGLGQTKAPARAPQSGARRTAPSTGEKTATKKPDDMAWLQEALKDPEFMKAVGHLMERLSNELQPPAPRTQSHILPRLSDSTMFYGAFPNYGPVLRQALQIWQQELHDSAALKNFLIKNKLEAGEPKFEEVVQKLVEFFDYLGDEQVITFGMRGKEPSGVLVAEVRKPGLSAFLEHVDQLLHADSKQHLRVVDPQQLQTATDSAGGEPIVLVRPDYVVIGFSAATVRDFNAQLEKGPGSFSANALGKRLAQGYQTGTSTIFGVDVQKLIGLIPQGSRQMAQMTTLLDKSGFGDARYALMENKAGGKNSTSEMELVFNGPRHGIASWIAASGPLGSLDFMSPKSALVEAFRLKPPAQMFDDIVELAGPMALQMLPQLEAQFNVNLKQDILSKLGGELAFEIESLPTPPPAGTHTAAQPNFKLLLSVTDANALQQTIKRLVAQSPIQPTERVEDGVTFYSVAPPSASTTGQEFNYFFLDGYLVLTSNREMAREAVRLHRSGGSVARAQAQPVKASAFVRQNANLFLTSMVSQLPPEVAKSLPAVLNNGEPAVNTMSAYADETSIRATTTSNVHTEAAVGLIVAAVAIPNLLRSKVAANESAAASTLRTINTAEVTYNVTYPRKGYAASLAALGPGGGDCSEPNVNASHACLLDSKLGDPSCTPGKWCEKGGYRFTVRGICTPGGICSGYVATATPVTAGSTGTKSYCSTTDAVIRSKEGAVDAPLTAAQCRMWKPI